jgi:hypothetical protein
MNVACLVRLLKMLYFPNDGRDCAGKRVRALHRPVGQEEREEGGEEHHRHILQQVSQPKPKAS